IGNHRVDLFHSKRVDKRRHDPREAAAVTALGDRRPPVNFAFTGGGGAGGEHNARMWCASAARAVATGAAGVEDRLARCETKRGRFQLLTTNRICAAAQDDEDDKKPSVENGYSMSEDNELRKSAFALLFRLRREIVQEQVRRCDFVALEIEEHRHPPSIMEG